MRGVSRRRWRNEFAPVWLVGCNGKAPVPCALGGSGLAFWALTVGVLQREVWVAGVGRALTVWIWAYCWLWVSALE